MSASLAELEAQARLDLAYADFPPHPWVLPRFGPSGAAAYDVVVVGAGMSGLSVAFRLLRERIVNILVIDKSPAGREGPWLTYARMDRLRTPKELVGPDCGFASLSFPAWYRALHGSAAWAGLGKAPRGLWMDYLNWFRRVAGIPVENGVALERIRPAPEGLLALELSRKGGPSVVYARKLVLATGFCGSGGGLVPALAQDLPKELYAHSAEEIHFASLRGKRVAVLGAGASAFDNAAVALESGAAAVSLFARRKGIEKKNVKEAEEFSNLLRHYESLGDETRWRLMRSATDDSAPPPPDSVARCTRHPNFQIHTQARLKELRPSGDGFTLIGAGVTERFDFLILGTGFLVDLARQPELAEIVDGIALWGDVYRPPPDERDESLARYPYLGPSFEFTEKMKGSAPYLSSLYAFGRPAVQSMGPVCVGVNGMKIGVPRLVHGISRSLFLEDADAHEAALNRSLRG